MVSVLILKKKKRVNSVAEGYHAYINHEIRYLLKATEGYAISLKNGNVTGFTDDKRKAGVFTKEVLLPLAKDIQSGKYEIVLWGMTK